MKNKVKILAGVSFLMLTVVAVCYTTSHSKVSDPWLEMNVEALTDGEFDPFEVCNYYCIDKQGSDCVLSTNLGFDIICKEMEPKSR